MQQKGVGLSSKEVSGVYMYMLADSICHHAYQRVTWSPWEYATKGGRPLIKGEVSGVYMYMLADSICHHV